MNFKQRVVDGDDPQIMVERLKPNSTARIHVVRFFEKWIARDESWERQNQGLHAWADFMSDEQGIINVSQSAPVQGCYHGKDSLALLRNGLPFGNEELSIIRRFVEADFPKDAAGKTFVKVEVDGKIVASKELEIRAEADGLTFKTIAEPGVHGIYAKPAGEGPFPVVITLHGSEGGSAAKARGSAARFASSGFACLAINYFAYEHEKVEGIPTQHLEIPIEIVAEGRNWLLRQREVDANNINLYGVSKGAEFALVAATKYDWIKSVVAVVPSDIIWAGYGDDQPAIQQRSSWSFEKQPFPFMPLFLFDPEQEGMYQTNTERYSRSRKFYDDRTNDARIEIEKANCKFLFLASDRDEVWASGDMTRNLVERLYDAGKSDQVSLKIFTKAGHQISGTGTFPIRLYGVQASEPDAKDLVAEGRAAAEAWQLTVDFLKVEK